jgi:hypothetical protein
MMIKRILIAFTALTLILSLVLNVNLLRSSHQLNLESLKWAVKSQFIKYEDLRNGKIDLITHTSGGIEYSKFLHQDQNDSQKELIQATGAIFSIFGLANGAGFNGLPRGLPKKVAECAISKKLDKDLYFTDKGLFNGTTAYVFYQGDISTKSLLGSLLPENSCSVEGKYRVQKSVMSWVLSEKKDSNLAPKQLSARFTLASGDRKTVITRLGEICPVGEEKSSRMNLECTQPMIDFSGSQKNTHFGVKSVLRDRDDLYIAYAINDNRCNRLEIKKIRLNERIKEIKPREIYYRSPGCFDPKTTELNAIGGRMIFSDSTKSKIIFSLGNAEIWTGLETIQPKEKYGNLLVLDISTKQTKVISLGHRNPQGICLSGQNLYASEQGPDGGDELNLIVENNHYGWPQESYGLPYGEFVSDAVKPRSYGHHKLFTKPLLSWVPAIAVGDLICPDNKMQGAWNENFLLATLKDSSIRRLVLDNGSIRVDERIPLGSRIRDIQIDSKGNLIALTDEASIISIKLIDR